MIFKFHCLLNSYQAVIGHFYFYINSYRLRQKYVFSDISIYRKFYIAPVSQILFFILFLFKRLHSFNLRGSIYIIVSKFYSYQLYYDSTNLFTDRNFALATGWTARVSKSTQTDLKKSQICPIWGQCDPICMPNLISLLKRVGNEDRRLSTETQLTVVNKKNITYD